MILDAWGWCTGTTQRDGTGREKRGGVQDREHVYTCGGFMFFHTERMVMQRPKAKHSWEVNELPE